VSPYEYSACYPQQETLLKGRFWESAKSLILIKKWCRRKDSNPRPDDYKSTALPTELLRHNAKHHTPQGFQLKTLIFTFVTHRVTHGKKHLPK
jgi:hypothetical protein